MVSSSKKQGSVKVPLGFQGRSSWKGILKLGAYACSVKAYPAIVSRKAIEMHQFHRDCGRRICLQKVCPRHGVLHATDIGKGVETSPGRILEVTEADNQKIELIQDGTIALEHLLEGTWLDLSLFAGRSFLLTADGLENLHPYAQLLASLMQRDKGIMAGMVFSQKRTPVWIRATSQGLVLDLLNHPENIKQSDPRLFQEVVLDTAELADLEGLLNALPRKSVGRAIGMIRPNAGRLGFR